jgi:hypothetical protein
MKVLAKFVMLSLLAGGTATVVHSDPVGGWLSPNGTSGQSMGPAPTGGAAPTSTTTTTAGGVGVSGTATVSGPGIAGTGTVSGGANLALTLGEMQSRVKTLHDQVRADARHITHLQLLARKEKDVIKLNCVNDKLVQVKPAMNIADAAEAELDTARDSDRLSIFTTISESAENVRRLREEADQCIGEPITNGFESSNTYTHPEIPDDPTKGFTGNQVEPPAYASPYN